jgi:hypothetical protein
MESPYAYFRITEKAGRFVAGRNNTGVGTPLLLSRREAQHDVRLGALVEVGKEAASDTDAITEANDGVTGAEDAGLDGDDTTLGGKVSEDGDIDLAKMTVKELRALAENSGVEIEDRATKAEIIAAIEASSG